MYICRRSGSWIRGQHVRCYRHIRRRGLCNLRLYRYHLFYNSVVRNILGLLPGSCIISDACESLVACCNEVIVIDNPNALADDYSSLLVEADTGAVGENSGLLVAVHCAVDAVYLMLYGFGYKLEVLGESVIKTGDLGLLAARVNIVIKGKTRSFVTLNVNSVVKGAVLACVGNIDVALREVVRGNKGVSEIERTAVVDAAALNRNILLGFCGFSSERSTGVVRYGGEALNHLKGGGAALGVFTYDVADCVLMDIDTCAVGTGRLRAAGVWAECLGIRSVFNYLTAGHVHHSTGSKVNAAAVSGRIRVVFFWL